MAFSVYHALFLIAIEYILCENPMSDFKQGITNERWKVQPDTITYMRKNKSSSKHDTTINAPFRCPLKPMPKNRISNETLYFADCSDLNLRHIPDCPDVLQNVIIGLDLSNNNLATLPRQSFMKYPNLVKLLLTDNSIINVRAGAFDGLTKLKQLSLSLLSVKKIDQTTFVPLKGLLSLEITGLPKGFTSESLSGSLCNVSSTLEHLTLNGPSLYSGQRAGWILDERFASCLSHTRIKHLDLSNDRIIEIKPGALPFPALEVVRLRNNRLLGTRDEFAQGGLLLQNLSYIDIGCQIGYLECFNWINVSIDSYTYFRPTNQILRPHEDITKPPVPSKLGNIIPEHAEQGRRIYIDALRKLKTVLLDQSSHLIWKADFSKYNVCLYNTPLQTVDLEGAKTMNISGTVPCLSKLKYLNLRGIAALDFDKGVFWEAPALETILLGGAFPTKYFMKEDSQLLFSKCTNLALLDLSYNAFTFFPNLLLHGLNKLRRLDLGFNKITKAHVDLRQKTKLRYLDLRFNKMLIITANMSLELQELHRTKLNMNSSNDIELDLRGNPLICSCWNIKIVLVLMENGVKFTGYKGNITSSSERVTCSVADGSTLSLIEAVSKLKSHCTSRYTPRLPFIIYATSLVMLIIASVMIRNKYKLHLLWYMFKYYVVSKRKHADKGGYEFDAFIVHNSEDAWWVLNQLLPNMGNPYLDHEETEFVLAEHWEHGRDRYEFCFDLKDFIPGVYITENVINCVSRSRRCILFVTKRFLKSNWCQFETVYAHSYFVQQGRSGLIAVVHPKVVRLRERGLLPIYMEVLFATVTYIEWPTKKDRRAFWLKLETALGAPEAKDRY